MRINWSVYSGDTLIWTICKMEWQFWRNIGGKIEWNDALFTTWAEDLNHAAQFGVERGFAPGTDKGTTRAKPNIWSNMDDFQSKLDDFRAAAAQLAETAAAGDPAESRQQFVATGGTCKACHDEYKSQDYLY